MLSRCNGHETEVSSLFLSFRDRNLNEPSTKISSRSRRMLEMTFADVQLLHADRGAIDTTGDSRT
jgi:hypothetical protein